MNYEQAIIQMEKDKVKGYKVFDRIFKGNVAEWYKLEISRIVLTPDMFWQGTYGKDKGGLMKFGESILMTKDAANQILPHTGVEVISKKTWTERSEEIDPITMMKTNCIVAAHGEAVVVTTLPSGDEKKMIVNVTTDVSAKLSDELLSALNKNKIKQDSPNYKMEVFKRWSRLSRHAEQGIVSKLQTKILFQAAALENFTEDHLKNGCILYVSRIVQNTENSDVRKIALINLANINEDLFGARAIEQAIPTIEHKEEEPVVLEAKENSFTVGVKEPTVKTKTASPETNNDGLFYLESVLSEIKRHPAAGSIVEKILISEKEEEIINNFAKQIEKLSKTYPDRPDLWVVGSCVVFPEMVPIKDRINASVERQTADMSGQLAWIASNLNEKRYR